MLAARSSAGIGRKSELLLGVHKQNCKSLHFASVRMSGPAAKSRYLDPIRWRYPVVSRFYCTDSIQTIIKSGESTYINLIDA